MHRLRAFFFAFVLFAAPLCAARDLAIVVNKGNPASTVTVAELEKLLKAATQTWPDGKKVKVILTDPGSPDTKTLLQRAYKLSPAEIKSLADAHRADIQIVSFFGGIRGRKAEPNVSLGEVRVKLNGLVPIAQGKIPAVVLVVDHPGLEVAGGSA